MIITDDFQELKTIWLKRIPGHGIISKQRITYGNRVVEVIQFRLFGRDVAISKTFEKLPATRSLL